MQSQRSTLDGYQLCSAWKALLWPLMAAMLCLYSMPALGSSQHLSTALSPGAEASPGQQYAEMSGPDDLPVNLSTVISLRLERLSLEEALRRIAEKADLDLVYGSENVSVEKQVTLNLKHVTAQEALKEVLRGTELGLMKLSGGQIVIIEQKAQDAKQRQYRMDPARLSLRPPTKAEPLALQTGTIAGTVVDSTSGEPIPGVNVVVVGTQQGASTDAEGQYEITGVEAGTYDLRASFIGYAPQTVEDVEVPADETTTVNFELRLSTIALEEVVAIGYGTAQRKNLTGSVSSVDVEEVAEAQTVDNIGQLLQGRVPGLSAGVATEADGGTNLEIRGRNSIEAGNDPLIVVDGVPYHQGDLSDINPSDVASIDVLKGASAAAVYGASAAAGVIEVTTKRGTSPEPTIRFKSSAGIATQGDVVQPYGPEEYVQYMQNVRQRLNPQAEDYFYADPRNLPSGITLEEWEALGTGGGEPVEIWLGRLGLAGNEIQNYIEGNTIDWHDRVYRNAALRQNYNLSISGRPEAVSYYWSLGYVDNQGEHVGDRFRTIRSRLNLSANATDWLEVGLRGQYANRNEGFLGANAGHAGNVSPYGDMYAEDGTLEWYPHGDATAQNPFLWTTQSGRRYDWRNHNLLATLFGNVDLPWGLGYEVRWTNEYDFRRNYLFNPSSTPFGEPSGNASRQEYSGYIWQVDNILSWGQTFADIHAFDATFLFNVEVHNAWVTDASSEQFPLEVLGYSGLPLGANPTVESDDSRTTGNALMGRLNYRLLDRYLFTVSYRRDGYSAFGRSHPYAYFPSAAFAWRISEEPFFGVDPISNLKLRLSWGKNGNRSIGTYSSLQRMSVNNYIYEGETVTGIGTTNLPNADLRWETTTQYNAGLDFGLLEGRVSGSVDAYYMSTGNLLMQRSLPSITGYNNIWSNLGEVVNRGLEMSLSSTNVASEQFSWSSSLIFSMNRNEIKHLYGTMVPIRNEEGEVIGQREADDRENGWFIGHALDEIYDYEVLGIWQEDEAEEAAVYGKEPGDFKLRDVNGDGVLSPVEDKVFQGYTEPRYRIGLGNNFSYRNFTASALITSQLGHYTAHNVHQHTGYTYGRHNQLNYPYWTPGNPTNEWARLGSAAESPSFNYWERTSFVKLQNLSIAYRIPESLTNRLSANDLRVFFNARNVFALSGFEGDDPETHQHTPRLYTLGVNLAF